MAQHPNSPWPQRDQELRDLCADPVLTYRDIGRLMDLNTDKVIGRAWRLGLRRPLTGEQRAKVIEARRLAKAATGSGWSDDRISRLREACDNPDWNWDERGEHCGVTGAAARKKVRHLKIEARPTPKPKGKPPAVTPASTALRREADVRAKAAIRRKAKPVPSRHVSVDDADLIARFLAEKGATQCPKGWAFGCDQVQYVGKTWKAA